MVSSLSWEFATKVRDLLHPRKTPYEIPKTELTKQTSASEQCYMHELLSAEELRNCTLSQVLRHIQQVLESMTRMVDVTLLWELFLQQLPTNIRMVITLSAGALNLNQLAQLADHIRSGGFTYSNHYYHQQSNTTAQLTDQVSELTRRVEDLTSQMSKAVKS